MRPLCSQAKLLAVLLFLSLGFAFASDKFENAGIALQPRMGHTATLLTDGRVLLDGGDIGNPYWRHCMECRIEAELYDPATGLVEKVGGLRPSRKYHTATLLADGRVLIAGGWMGRGSFRTAEIFDPTTKKFTRVGDMSIERSRHSAHLLKDGRVLIFENSNSIDVFDPDTQTFRPVRAVAAAGSYPRAILLDDDRVLFAGGFFFDAGVLRLEGTLEPVNFHRHGLGLEDHSMTLLPDGSVLLAGGNEDWGGWDYGFTSNTYRTDLIDPLKRSSTEGSKMLAARSSHSATLLLDGRVLLAGGFGGDENSQSSAEFFDTSLRRIHPAPEMSARRSEHSATLLRDGRVLIAGGLVASAEMFISDVAPKMLEVLTLDGQGAVLHGGTARLVSAADPAKVGDVVEIYARGLFGGKMKPKVSIGGRLAEVLYFGAAPGLDGVQQINVRIPERSVTGGEVPLWLLDLERPSRPVMIGVRE